MKNWDHFFLDFAEQVAQQSYDIKTKVGTVITRDDAILSYSYNGTPRGWSNVMRDDKGKTLPCVIHSEIYALAKLCRSTETSVGATLYCTLSPCIECSKACVAAGISRVVYRDNYKCLDGVSFLVDNNTETVQIPMTPDGYQRPKIRCYGSCNHESLFNRDELQHTGL
jgi:dCMP deaminase